MLKENQPIRKLVTIETELLNTCHINSDTVHTKVIHGEEKPSKQIIPFFQSTCTYVIFLLNSCPFHIQVYTFEKIIHLSPIKINQIQQNQERNLLQNANFMYNPYKCYLKTTTPK